MDSMGLLACSVIQSSTHFTVSAWDLAALTHGDGELCVAAQISQRVCLRCGNNNWRQIQSCLYLLTCRLTDTEHLSYLSL